MPSLAPKTVEIFDKVCGLECIKPYTLVGGTALSLQLHGRLSEDLDFMSWISSVKERPSVDWPRIEAELNSVAQVHNLDVLGFDHVEMNVSGVKISFYIASRRAPKMHRIEFKENLYLADPMAIGAMKLEVMLRRSKFRDYYDIYTLMKNGFDLNEMIRLGLAYSGHRLKSRNIISMLTDCSRFHKDDVFEMLSPVYDVDSKDISMYIENYFSAHPFE